VEQTWPWHSLSTWIASPALPEPTMLEEYIITFSIMKMVFRIVSSDNVLQHLIMVHFAFGSGVGKKKENSFPSVISMITLLLAMDMMFTSKTLFFHTIHLNRHFHRIPQPIDAGTMINPVMLG
jgi:hypothetical protein